MSIAEPLFRSIASVLVFVNVLGNSLVILVILKSRSMKNPINYLLLNLAVADLMVGVFVVPRFILDGTFTHPRGLSGDIICKVITNGHLAWISQYSSIFSLVFIAFGRYYAIMKPLSIRHRITTRKLKTFIPICWTIAVILVLPNIYFAYYDENRQKCRFSWPSLWVKKLSNLLFIVVGGILPTSIMAVLYSRVIHRLWFKRDGGNYATLQAVKRSRKKVTKMMLTLSVIYVLCWWPDGVMHNLKTFFDISYPRILSNVFDCLIVLNSTVNPIVYTFQFEEFRKGLRKIFRRREERRTRQDDLKMKARN